MRREMKYAIGIGILIIAVGIWFFNSAEPITEPLDAGSGIVDATEAPADPGAEIIVEPEPMVELVVGPESAFVDPAIEDTTNTVGSPAPAIGPADEEQGARPVTSDLSGIDLNLDTAKPAATEDVSQPTEEGMVVWEPGLEPATNNEGEAETGIAADRLILEAEPAAIDIKPEKEPAELKTHTIQPGDTFSKLAAQYLGHAKYAGLIGQANPDLDPRRLQIGSTIRIPERPESAARTTIAARPIVKASVIPEGRRYTVQVGETWYDLGKKFLGNGMRGVELYELNKERVPRDPNLLRTGTIIELPAGVTAAP